MDARGISITGGEPLLELEEIIDKIRFLKNEFGKDFHIHLYTSKPISSSEIKKLATARLDEIRYHPPELELTNKFVHSIEKSSEIIDEVGLEVPAIPNKEKKILELSNEVKKHIDFLNLNEFEYSENSYKQIKDKGFEIKEKNRNAVQGSEKTAKNLIEKNLDFTVHFCPSHYKDSTQLRRRFLRRAKNVSKNYEHITEEGTIVKGVIKSNNPERVMRVLERNEVPKNLINRKKEKIETAWFVVEELKTQIKSEGTKSIEIVEQHPTKQRLVVERIPL